MLKKNVYILYPAGYHGNYVKWAIEVSDAENKTITKDPINSLNSQKFGGVGTAHVHTRIPTHQAINLHHIWYIFNKPQDNRVYVINSGAGRVDVSNTVHELLLEDPTGIVINLHDADDKAWAAYGRINCVTKWPTFMAVTPIFASIHKNFDAFDCANDILFRNYVVEHQPFGSCGSPDRNLIQQYLNNYEAWFTVRNHYQPHEVNHDTYPSMPDLKSRFFDFSLGQILNKDFPGVLKQLIKTTGIIDSINTSPVEQIHERYLEKQLNLQWFESLASWTETGRLDPYLQSHSMIQAELIIRIFDNMGVGFPSRSKVVNWLYSYNNILRNKDWPFLWNTDDFYTLPQFIRDELMMRQIDSIPRLPSDEFAPQWHTQSLSEINYIYQKKRYR
jgi:hypothetical protein